MSEGGKDRIAQLEDELAVAKWELRAVCGQLKTVLNNWEQAKGKLRRKKAELDERERMLDARDATTAEEMCAEQVGYWKRQAEKARAECEDYREKLGRVLDLAHEISGVGR